MPRWANEATYDSQIVQAIRDVALGDSWLPVVKGIIAAESGFVPSAQRAEPTYRCPIDGTMGDASRGLMQILHCTARGMGYAGTAQGLFDPTTNLAWGVRYLRDRLVAKGFDLWAAVSAYNNGSGKRATVATRFCLARDSSGNCVQYFTAQPGQLLNQPYVDKVKAAADYFAGQLGMAPLAPTSLPPAIGSALVPPTVATLPPVVVQAPADPAAPGDGSSSSVGPVVAIAIAAGAALVLDAIT